MVSLPKVCDRCGHGADRHYSGSSPECQEREGNFCAALDCRCRGFRGVLEGQQVVNPPFRAEQNVEESLVDDLLTVGRFIWEQGARDCEDWKKRLVDMVGEREVLLYVPRLWPEISGTPVPEPAPPPEVPRAWEAAAGVPLPIGWDAEKVRQVREAVEGFRRRTAPATSAHPSPPRMIDRRGTRLVLATLAVSLLAAFALFVWPSAYRYTEWEKMPVRINRVTGRAWVLTANGWFPLDPAPTTATTPAGQDAPRSRR